VPLPETFGETKRLALFAYVALRTPSAISLEEIFDSFQKDHAKLAEALSHYRTQCSSRLARRFFQSGLPARGAYRSLTDYARTTNGLGLVAAETRGGSTVFKPNWLTITLRSLRNVSQYEALDFELPIPFKLLMADQLFTRDTILLGALLSSIKKAEERGLTLSNLRREITLDYVSMAHEYMIRELTSDRRTSEGSQTANRVDFFARNLRLLRAGEPASPGLRHPLEARLQWLVDLRFIDLTLLCRDERIHLSPFLENYSIKQGLLASDERDKTLVAYARYLKVIFGEEASKIDLPSEVGLLAEHSVALLRSIYGELVPTDAVIYMTKILAALMVEKPLIGNIVLEELSRKHKIYRDWRGSGAFVG